jgi:uncharacterized repeat protein (TIGR01451 family)
MKIITSSIFAVLSVVTFFTARAVGGGPTPVVIATPLHDTVQVIDRDAQAWEFKERGFYSWHKLNYSMFLDNHDSLRTLKPKGKAKLRWMNQAQLYLGPGSRVSIYRVKRPQSPDEKRGFWGNLWMTYKRFSGAEPYYWDTFNVPARLTPKGTEYMVQCRQRIAYVNGNDLWLMFDDGSGRTNFISAPASQRIGRSAFSPDGSKVAYEVWTSSGCNLWAADGNGQNAHLLLSAGSLAEGTGHPGYTYQARRLAGPSFSPDGSQISFLRIQEYRRSGYSLKEKELCIMPIAGGSVNVLWKTMEIPGGYGDYDIGENTCWLDNGTISFIRSGKMGVRFSAWVDASNTNKTAWPCEVYLEYDDENGRNPTYLSANVDGEVFTPGFAGYGEVYTASSAWTWLPFAEDSGWLTPQMGAYYGPHKTHDLTAGTKNVTLIAQNGRTTLHSQTFELNVIKGSKTYINQAGNYYAESAEGGVWAISSGGGAPYQLTRALADSVAWSSDRTQFFIDYENYGTVSSTYLMLYDGQGRIQDYALLGDGTQSSVGNWDAFDERAIAWYGSGSDGGTIRMVDVDTGDVTELGTGKYPMFVPLYQVETCVFEGEVSVLETNRQVEVTAHSGQSVVLDSLANQGLPQSATPLRGPYVTNIVPAWGSTIPNNSNVTVRFQFSVPVSASSLLSNELIAISWPAQADESVEAFAASAAQYAAALRDGLAYQDAVSNVARRGLGATSWNAQGTEFSLVITNLEFSRAAGNDCEVGLDLSGVQGTNGNRFAFNAAETLFQFADPADSDGGVIQSPSGGKLTIPAGALPGPVAVGIQYSRTLPGEPPSGLMSMTADSTWKPASGVYTFEPTGQTLSAQATIELPVDGPYPELSIWRFNGSTWTNLGGAYSMASGTVSVAVNRLGIFAAFYRPSTNAFLRLIQTADRSSAARGEEVGYSLTLDNLGAQAASSVVVADTLPSSLNYVTNSAGTNALWNPDTRTLTWNCGSLPTGHLVNLSFQALVAAQAAYGETIANTARVSATGIAATNGNIAQVRVGWPAEAPRLGAGGLESTNNSALGVLGSRWRRVPFDITTTQARDPSLMDWTFFDAQVRSNQTAGISTYAIVNLRPVANEWPSAPEFAAAFARYVQRYDGNGIDDMPGLSKALHHWEIFDVFTPNAGRWAGCSLFMYADYLVQAHATAHASDSEATLLSSAFEGGPATVPTHYLQQLIVEAPWAFDAIDAISVHDFWELTPSTVNPTSWVPQYLEADDLVALRDEADLNNKPYWFSRVDFQNTYNTLKTGGYTCTQTDNALFLARAIPFALAMGVGHILYNEMNRGTNTSEAATWASLLDTANNRRMSFYVLQKMIEKLEGFTEAVPPQRTGADIVTKFIQTNNQPIWVLWNASNRPSVISVPIGPVSQARITVALPASFNNSTATWSVSTNSVIGGLATISVSGTPVYVEAIGEVNPDLNGNGIPNEQDSDLDGDDLPNDWEIAHGLNAFASNATSDPDGDGFSNLDEYRAGTDPQNENSLLENRQVMASNGAFRVEWQSISGRTYRIQWSQNCGKSAWSNAADGLIQAVGSQTVWIDSGPPKTPSLTNASIRVYRVVGGD